MRKIAAALALIASVVMVPSYITAEEVTPADFERGNNQGWVRG